MVASYDIGKLVHEGERVVIPTKFLECPVKIIDEGNRIPPDTLSILMKLVDTGKAIYGGKVLTAKPGPLFVTANYADEGNFTFTPPFLDRFDVAVMTTSPAPWDLKKIRDRGDEKLNGNLESLMIIPEKLKLDMQRIRKEIYALSQESEGEILTYYSKVMSQMKQSDEIVRINKLIEALRNAMYSAKGMKDVYQDKTEFSNSINEVKYEMYHQFQSELSEFYKLLYVSFTNKEMNNGLESISSLLEKNKTDFDERINHIYFHAGQNMLKEKDIATLFNLNRELYSSCKAIALAVKDYKDKSI